MAMAKIFRNSVPNCKVIHPDGRVINFFGGKCICTVEKDINYLESLVANSNEAGVFIDEKEFEVDTEDLTPEGMIAKIKREAVAEFLAQQAAAAKLVSNSSDQPAPLGAGTTATLVNSLASNGAATVKQAEAGVVASAPEAGIKVSAPKK